MEDSVDELSQSVFTSSGVHDASGFVLQKSRGIYFRSSCQGERDFFFLTSGGATAQHDSQLALWWVSVFNYSESTASQRKKPSVSSLDSLLFLFVRNQFRSNCSIHADTVCKLAVLEQQNWAVLAVTHECESTFMTYFILQFPACRGIEPPYSSVSVLALGAGPVFTPWLTSR